MEDQAQNSIQLAEWLRLVVSLVLGAVLGAMTSLLVQWRSNKAARLRQRQGEVSRHCDHLLTLLRQVPGGGGLAAKYQIEGVVQRSFETAFTDISNRLSMWTGDPNATMRTLQDALSVLVALGNREDPTGATTLSPGIFRDGAALNKYVTIVEPIDKKFRERLESALRRCPVISDADFLEDVRAAVASLKTEFRHEAEDWPLYRAKLPDSGSS